jgi:hypothetical protein
MKVTGLVAAEESAREGCSRNLLRALNRCLPRKAVNVIITGNADKDASPAAAEIFHYALRRHVDAWIDSGKSDGVECPYQRVIPHNVLLEYTERNPVVWDIFAPDRELRLLVAPRNTEQSDQKQAAYDAAVALFIQLLDSPGRARLARCDDCGTYFLRKRMPKRDTPIKRGSFCPEHKGEGAAQRTNATRDRRIKQLIELAAKYWPKCKQEGRERSEWVAEKMRLALRQNPNAELFQFSSIQGKWATQHQDEIEAEVKRRNIAGRE